jgi:hypothetical protein
MAAIGTGLAGVVNKMRSVRPSPFARSVAGEARKKCGRG